MMVISVDLLYWIISFLIKKTSCSRIEDISNKELAEELHKLFIRKWKMKDDERKVHSSFIDNIWGADLADMQLISKFNKRFRFSLRVFDIYSICTWFIALKDKKGIMTTNSIQIILDESNCKPNKIWVDKGSEFCNRSVKSWLEKKWYGNIFNK